MVVHFYPIQVKFIGILIGQSCILISHRRSKMLLKWSVRPRVMALWKPYVQNSLCKPTYLRFIDSQKRVLKAYIIFFYRAMLCIRGTSHGPVSVCPPVRLPVTSRCSTKTAKHRIIQRTPHDSAMTLVFWRQRSPRNSTRVTPYAGAKCRWGGSKSATFDI